MSQPRLSSLLPEVSNSTFWDQKDKFMFYEDVYDTWVMFAVEAGSFYYEIGDEKGTATFGDLVLCPPGTPFRRVIVTPLTFYYFELTWRGLQTPGAVGEEALPPGKLSIFNTGRLEQNYAAMRKWQAWPGEIRFPKNTHFCRDIWLLYCEGLEEGVLTGEDERQHPDPLMQEARSLIGRRAFTTLNLKEIAGMLGITPMQLTKKFSAAYGVAPVRYLTSLRLAKAKTLLVETNLTIEQISECCGYQNGFYLTRIFAKYEHTTPSHYRKTHRV